MNRQEISRLGGIATYTKYGREYMRELGRKGAKSFWRKYTFVPIGYNNFAIVNKETNQIVATQFPILIKS